MSSPLRCRYCLLVACLLVGTASVPSAQEPTRRIRGTDEFSLAYWPADEEQAEIASQAAGVAIQRLKYALGLESAPRIQIELCHTHKEFNERVGEKSALWILGRAFAREHRVVVKALGPARIGKLVAHEIMHVLLQLKLDETGAPAVRWLHEGLAKYVTGDLPMTERELLGQAATRGELLRLNELEAAFAGPRAQVSLAYAQSYTLVEYLTSLEGKTGLSGFLEELGRVKDVDRALVRAYQMPVNQLEEEWLTGLTRTYLGMRGPNVFGDWLWAAIAGLFLVALLVQLRRSRAIRQRMQEEELLRQMIQGKSVDQTEIEEAP